MTRRQGIAWLVGAVLLYAAHARWAEDSKVAYAAVNVLLVAHYVWGLKRWSSGVVPARILLFGGAVIAGAHLWATPVASKDALTYAVHGYLGGERGANPYLASPREAQHSPIAAELTELGYRFHHKHPSPYGPLWTMVEFGVWKVFGTVRGALTGFQLVGLLSWAACGFFLWRSPGGKVAALAVLLNPVVLLEGVRDAHLDMLAYALVAAAWWLRRERPGYAWGMALGLAAAVKPTMLLFVPAFGLPGGVIVAAVLAAAYAPFWAGTQTMEGLVSHASGLPFAPFFLTAAVGSALWLAWRERQATVLPLALAMGGYWYPWYYIAFIGELAALLPAATVYLAVVTAVGRAFPLVPFDFALGLHHAVPHQVACLVLLGVVLSRPSRWRRPTGSSRPRG